MAILYNSGFHLPDDASNIPYFIVCNEDIPGNLTVRDSSLVNSGQSSYSKTCIFSISTNIQAHILKGQILYGCICTHTAKHSTIITKIQILLCNCQIANRMPITIESAGIICINITKSHRFPFRTRKVYVMGQGTIQRRVTLRRFRPCHQAVGGIDGIGATIFGNRVSVTRVCRITALAATVGPILDGVVH